MKKTGDKESSTASGQEMSQVATPNPPSNPFEDSIKTSISSLSRPQSSGSPSSLIINQQCASRRQTLDVVKHQVMANYLYQQQGNNGWRSNDESLSQGIMLRLSKENYLTHPPQLGQSNLAVTLRNLNVQVSNVIALRFPQINISNRPR